MPDTIAIRNPAIRELVADAQQKGMGRSATETAENLIRDGWEYRRLREVDADHKPRARRLSSKAAH